MIDPVYKIALPLPEAAEAVGLTEGEFKGAVKRGELPSGKRYGAVCCGA